MRITALTSFLLLLSTGVFAQTLIYEDSFVGGVTASAFGQNISGGGTGDIDIEIVPGSTIREAWLLVGRFGAAPDITFTMNGVEYELNASNQVSETFNVQFYGGDSGVHGIEVTDDIDPNVNTYTISIGSQSATSNRYQSFYLFVAFENEDLDLVNAYLYANNDDDFPSQNFNCQDLAVFPDDGDITVSSFSSYACDPDFDAQFLDVNGNTVGAMGGADAGSDWCSSVAGSFTYSNGVATGLNDDIADGIVNAGDGLVNINDFVSGGDTSVELIFYDGPDAVTSDNIQWAASLVYGSACEIPEYEVSEDTSVCPGQEVTLFATGGNAYEWSGPEPIEDNTLDAIVVAPEESAEYQVQISFPNGCSTSETITVTVDDNGANIETEITNILCDVAGSIVASANNLTAPLEWTLNDEIIESTAVTIEEPGEYTFEVTDANGCVGSTTVEVTENNGGAELSLASTTIICDLSATITGSTQNMTGPYEWTLDEEPFPGPTFEVFEAGEYTVTVTDANGCSDESVIMVNDTLIGNADFDILGSILSVPAEVEVLNTSIDLDEFVWVSGDDSLFTEHATFQYDIPGEYMITLIGVNSVTGCTDSISVAFEVLPEAVLYIPNAFTPDQNGINEVFKVVGTGIDPSRFSMKIYNRWGDSVFSTTDPDQGWIGNVRGGEYYAPDGVYVYVVSWAKYDQPDVAIVKGHVTLIR